MAKLYDLLPDELKSGLTKAEELLLQGLPTGQGLSCRTGKPQEDDPVNASKWGEGRTIRGEFLKWLCTNQEITSYIHQRGIGIVGMRIIGGLNLIGEVVTCRLTFVLCAFPDGVDMEHADTPLFMFQQCRISSLTANYLRARERVKLDNSYINGETGFMNADIDGTLECNRTTFNNPGKIAFAGDGIKISGHAYLSGMTVNGEFRLPDSHVGGILTCDNAKFINENEMAFFGDGIVVDSRFSFQKTVFKGMVRLIGAKCGGNLEFNDAKLSEPGGIALAADMINVTNSIVFSGEFHAKGEVRILAATVGGQLQCEGGFFENPDGVALHADFLHIKHDVFLTAIRRGEKVERVFSAIGEIRFVDTIIGGSFVCQNASLHNPVGTAMRLDSSNIAGSLRLKDITRLEGILNLENTRVKLLNDDSGSWPTKGKLIINAFEYENFAGDGIHLDAKERLRWLGLRKPGAFSLQPFEQLAKTFRRMGFEDSAEEALIAKYDALRKSGILSAPSRIFYAAWGSVLSYGFRIRRVLWGFLIMFILGSAAFWIAGIMDIMQPSKERVYMDYGFVHSNVIPDEYPKFEPLIYSLDALVPLVDLHQENYWLPDITKPGPELILGWSIGWIIRGYLWFHIIVGWVLSSMLVAYFAGFIRRQRE